MLRCKSLQKTSRHSSTLWDCVNAWYVRGGWTPLLVLPGFRQFAVRWCFNL